jgi:hypothetical protein
VASDVPAGEVQQLVDGRWRVVLTAGGIPVDDRRRHGGFGWPDPTGAGIGDFAESVAAGTGIDAAVIATLMGYGRGQGR